MEELKQREFKKQKEVQNKVLKKEEKVHELVKRLYMLTKFVP